MLIGFVSFRMIPRLSMSKKHRNESSHSTRVPFEDPFDAHIGIEPSTLIPVPSAPPPGTQTAQSEPMTGSAQELLERNRTRRQKEFLARDEVLEQAPKNDTEPRERPKGRRQTHFLGQDETPPQTPSSHSNASDVDDINPAMRKQLVTKALQ